MSFSRASDDLAGTQCETRCALQAEIVVFAKLPFSRCCRNQEESGKQCAPLQAYPAIYTLVRMPPQCSVDGKGQGDRLGLDVFGDVFEHVDVEKLAYVVSGQIFDSGVDD